MSIYKYVAIDDLSKQVVGEVVAENEKALESSLNLQGLYLLKAEKQEAIIKRPAGAIQTFCPKCNFLVDTNYDAAGVFGLCTNPECQWIVNLKEDSYSVGRPSFIQEFHLHKHQHLHQEREAIKSPAPKTPPKGTIWCPACDRFVAPTHPVNWLLLIALIFTGIGWAFYLIYYALQSPRCPICRAKLE